MTKRRKPQRTERPWQPMQRGEQVVRPEQHAAQVAALRDRGADEDTIDRLLGAREVWLNDRYVVHVERRPEDGSVAELSIRRQDRKAIHDWRHFQRIKNDIAGRDVEAFELYPAQERVVDTANQYFLWCLPPGRRIPAGFIKGELADDSIAGSVQRPVPDDWKEEADVANP